LKKEEEKKREKKNGDVYIYEKVKVHSLHVPNKKCLLK